MNDDCINCNSKAEAYLSPDLDIKGIPVCNSCKDEIKQDLLLLIMDIEDFNEKWFENKYNLNKRKEE